MAKGGGGMRNRYIDPKNGRRSDEYWVRYKDWGTADRCYKQWAKVDGQAVTLAGYANLDLFARNENVEDFGKPFNPEGPTAISEGITGLMLGYGVTLADALLDAEGRLFAVVPSDLGDKYAQSLAVWGLSPRYGGDPEWTAPSEEAQYGIWYVFYDEAASLGEPLTGWYGIDQLWKDSGNIEERPDVGTYAHAVARCADLNRDFGDGAHYRPRRYLPTVECPQGSELGLVYQS